MGFSFWLPAQFYGYGKDEPRERRRSDSVCGRIELTTGKNRGASCARTGHAGQRARAGIYVAVGRTPLAVLKR